MSQMGTKLFSATTYLGNITGGCSTYSCVNHDIGVIAQACSEIIEAINLSVGRGAGRYFNQLITDGVYIAAELPEAEVTWETIVLAWREAPLLGRASTVVSIDAMRKEIWNEHISFKDLAFPQGF